jgi:NAD(P)-dependent dehydrogenase (short-subunit alcohol dehydrogenase family)
MGMQDRTVMITGAAGSLGRAVAETFYQAGATLALVDLQLEALQKAYPGSDPRRRLLAANLTDAASAAAAVQQAGRVDALCNIAGGFAMGTPVHATPAADWKKMWDINAATLLNMVQAVVPGMIAQGRGSIVNVGAGAGQKGAAMMGAYSVSKSAVIRMTEAMSAELREQGVNVNCVLPSIIDTPPNRAAMPEADPSKWVAPKDLASVILFLCSDDARAVHGAALPVVGLS